MLGAGIFAVGRFRVIPVDKWQRHQDQTTIISIGFALSELIRLGGYLCSLARGRGRCSFSVAKNRFEELVSKWPAIGRCIFLPFVSLFHSSKRLYDFIQGFWI